MILLLEDGSERDLPTFELHAEKAIYVSPLCSAVIPHATFLKTCNDPVMVISKAGVFMGRGLLVENTIVREGKLQTNVFNITNERVKVRRGECISQLIEVHLTTNFIDITSYGGPRQAMHRDTGEVVDASDLTWSTPFGPGTKITDVIITEDKDADKD